MATPINTFTFDGTVTIDGHSRPMHEVNAPLPGGIKESYTQVGNTLNITADMPNGQQINFSIQDDNGHLTGDFAVGGGHMVQIDGTGHFN